MADGQTRFEHDTAIGQRDDRTFLADVDSGWWVAQRPNGGYLAAIILQAIMARVDDPTRAPRSLTVHYPAPAAAGPVVSTRRSGVPVGRSPSTRRVSSRPAARRARARRVLEVPIRARVRRRPDARRAPSRVAARSVPPPHVLEVARRWAWRWVIGSPPVPDAPAADEAVIAGWMRLEEPQPMTAPAITAAADGSMPAIFTRVGPSTIVVPTIDDRPRPDPAVAPRRGARRVRPRPVRTNAGTDGFLEEDSVIWAADGTLLAPSRQLGVALSISG